MTRADILTAFLKKSMCPVLLAVVPVQPVLSACRAVWDGQLYVPAYAVRDPLWHTVYVPAANVLWQFRDRDRNRLF